MAKKTWDQMTPCEQIESLRVQLGSVIEQKRIAGSEGRWIRHMGLESKERRLRVWINRMEAQEGGLSK